MSTELSGQLVVRRLLTAIQARMNATVAAGPQWAQGQIGAVNADGTVQVSIGGDPVAVKAFRLASYQASVDDIVEVRTQNGYAVVHGVTATTPPPTPAPTPIVYPSDSAWTAVAAFTNSWTSSGTPPRYIMMGGVVYLGGAMIAGTAGAAAFTLPVGYRPSQSILTLVSIGNATANLISVSTAGLVTPLNAANVWLSGISFPTV